MINLKHQKPSLVVISETVDEPLSVHLDTPSPLYEQIKNILRTRILEGVYQPNQKMPSESEMISAFGVSRITVRQALSDLQSEGLIFRVHGKGTFVSKPRAFQDLGSSLQGFGIAMRQMGYESHSKVLSMRNIVAPFQVQEKLQLTGKAKVTELRRLRFLNREPISVDVTYLSTSLGARLAKANLVSRDIFAILENDFQIPLGHADLQISSGLTDEILAEQLCIAEGSPISFIERTVYRTDNTPIEFEHLYYRGDAFKFKFRVDRAPKA